MPLGHMMLGLLGGIAAVAVALAAGLAIWLAAVLYVAVGNLCLGLSVLAQVVTDRTRRPPPRRSRAPRRAARLRALRASH